MARRRNAGTDVTGLLVAVIVLTGFYLYYKEPEVFSVLFWATLALGVVLIVTLVYTHFKRLRILRDSNIHQIDAMGGIEFEKYIAVLLKSRGFTDVRLTQQYDLGIDVIARKNGETWGIQVKRYRGKVGLDAVRQAVASMRYYKCTKSMVITNSYFTRNARIIAQTEQCTLIDRDALIRVLAEHNRGNDAVAYPL